MDQRRPFENFESGADIANEAHQNDVSGEEVDCDFGLNESEDDLHTITENSQEPDVGDSKKINQLIQTHLHNKQLRKESLRQSEVSKDSQKFLQKTPDKANLFQTLETKVSY